MIVAICAASKGDLPLDIKWYFNTDAIKSGINGVALTNTKRTSQLTIESVSHKNQGNYTCVVKNQAGITNHTAELFVNGIFDAISQFSRLILRVPFLDRISFCFA